MQLTELFESERIRDAEWPAIRPPQSCEVSSAAGCATQVPCESTDVGAGSAGNHDVNFVIAYRRNIPSVHDHANGGEFERCTLSCGVVCARAIYRLR